MPQVGVVDAVRHEAASLDACPVRIHRRQSARGHRVVAPGLAGAVAGITAKHREIVTLARSSALRIDPVRLASLTWQGAFQQAVQVVDATAHDDGSFGPAGELTVTLSVADPALREPLIQAVREGEVTLVRSTHMSGGAG